MKAKDGGWILPDVINPSRVCVRMEIPNDSAHMAAFWGALWELTFWKNWQRDAQKRGIDVAKVWSDVWFEAKRLNDDLLACVPSIACAYDLRYNEETGLIEASFDGGETYEPSPELDPRRVNAHVPPTGTNVRCNAAERIAAQIRIIVEALIEAIQGGALAADIGALIVLLMALFGAFAVLLALAVALGAVLLSIGYVDLYNSFASFNWVTFKCLILKHMPSNGALTQARLDALYAEVGTTYSGTQKTVLQGILAFAGYGGLNGMSATGTEVGNCVPCSTNWSRDIYIPLVWANRTADRPRRVCGQGRVGELAYGVLATRSSLPTICTATTAETDNAQRLAFNLNVNIPQNVLVTHCLIYWGQLAGGAGSRAISCDFDGTVYNCFTNSAFMPMGINGSANWQAGSAHNLYASINSGIANDPRRYDVYRIELRGTGSPPDGWLTSYL